MSEPDILTRLGDCITFTTAHNMDGLTAALTDARDEIVALRRANDGLRDDLLTARSERVLRKHYDAGIEKARAEALDEARQACRRLQSGADFHAAWEEGIGYRDACDDCAAAIKALMEQDEDRQCG